VAKVERSIPSNLLLFHQIATLIRQGVLRSKIGQTYPLDDIKSATEQAGMTGRQGKVLLKLNQRI